MSKIYEMEVQTIQGEKKKLDQYKNQVLLIVNVASKCGLTPQYEGLEALYKKYSPKGLRILGFPSNDFMGQEPGTEKEILHFCQTQYGVSFDMFSKIKVTGSEMHPLYKILTETTKSEVTWNFQKFLVSRDGVITSFGPKVLPKELEPEIEKALR